MISDKSDMESWLAERDFRRDNSEGQWTLTQGIRQVKVQCASYEEGLGIVTTVLNAKTGAVMASHVCGSPRAEDAFAHVLLAKKFISTTLKAPASKP